MNVLVTGISGFVGQNVKRAFEKQGHSVYAVPREALLLGGEKLDEAVKNMDAVINLAGASILGRWTEKKMIDILESRRVGTRNLVRSLQASSRKPELFINASAIGIYKPDVFCDEESVDWGDNFLARVVRAWEGELKTLSGMRKVVLRFGMILGKGSSVCRKLSPFLKARLAIIPGNGMQEFPLVHIEDIIGFMLYVTNHPETEGVYNLVIPHSVTYAEFIKSITGIRKPFLTFRVPEWMLKIGVGKAAEIYTHTPHVIPLRLLKSDYILKYRTINDILH